MMLRKIPLRAFRQLGAHPTTPLRYLRCVPSNIGCRYSSTSPDEFSSIGSDESSSIGPDKSPAQSNFRTVYVGGRSREAAKDGIYDHAIQWEEPTFDGKYIKLGSHPSSTDDGELRAKFGQQYLRENCHCSGCLDHQTLQRKYLSLDHSFSMRVMKVSHRLNYVYVQFADGHIGVYPYKWLRTYQNRRPAQISDTMRIRSYRHFPPTEKPPSVPYQDVMGNDDGLLKWLSLIHEYGFCLVEGIPVTPEATKALVERVAFIRETHYGGFWDFTADMTFKDSAYGSEALDPHTDTTYFTDPARLQLFHLLSHTDGDGGESVLVDGFVAANTLRRNDLVENPKGPLTRTLAEIRQPWHSSGNQDACIQPIMQYPVFNTSPDTFQLYQIRWNEYDRTAKQDWDVETQERWYEAARNFNRIIKNPGSQIRLQLKPGTALMFDNWRMLHGRESFTGKRRMCGAYVNNDDFLSRLRLLKFGRRRVLDNLGSTIRWPGNPNRTF